VTAEQVDALVSAQLPPIEVTVDEFTFHIYTARAHLQECDQVHDALDLQDVS